MIWWAGWAWWALAASGSFVSGISWHFFADGGHGLVSTWGIHLYGEHPELQVGPVALLAAALLQAWGATLGKVLALTLMALAGPGMVLALSGLVGGPRKQVRLVVALLVLAPGWLDLALRWGHLDDVLAMVGAVGAVRAVHAGKGWVAGLWLAFAIGAKPWALGFVPVVLALPGEVLIALAVAGAGTCVAWAPFLIGDSRTVSALHPPVALVQHSGLHALGARGEVVPAWGRTVQLLATPAVAAVAALRGHWPGVLVIAVAVRIATDPQDNAYYIGSAAMAALVFDLVATGWLVPWTTVVTTLVLWQPYTVDYMSWRSRTSGLNHFWFAHPGTVGGLHLLWALAVTVLVMRYDRQSPQPIGITSNGAANGTPIR